MHEEIIRFLSAVIPYEEKYGAWTVDDIASIADTTILKYLIERKLVKKIEEGMNPTFHTTDKAAKYIKREEVEKVVEQQKEGQLVIPPNLLDDIIGLDEIKELIHMALEAEDPVHIGFVGPPSSAKSLILYCLEQSLPGAVYIDSAIATKMGIAKTIATYKPRYLLMDEFDKMEIDDYNALLTVMSSGRLVSTKAYGRTDIPLKTWVFAAMNSLRIPTTIKERFLTIVRLTEYDRVSAMNVMMNILIKRGVEEGLAGYIARKVVDDMGERNPRKAIQIANMCNTKEKVDRAVKLILSGQGIYE